MWVAIRRAASELWECKGWDDLLACACIGTVTLVAKVIIIVGTLRVLGVDI